MREGDLFSDRGEFLKFDFRPNAACGYGLGGMTVGSAQYALTADALIVPFSGLIDRGTPALGNATSPEITYRMPGPTW
jgi:hypothetical protein